ncbi:hypothetical protein GCM10010145_31480 [Streptomyces ruber]|uniref:Uncharacterized protein n=2 Tax=Streptomyces TaxID=1883 RepID=A0A918ER21_9ACTN|nr:hypothetical protein GCM10010145_31480 [Streptomyces ruber]
MVALSVWASLASATARKETRIAQNTATRIPATSPPDTAHPLPGTCLNIEKSCPEPIAPGMSLRTALTRYRMTRRAHGMRKARRPARLEGGGGTTG